jgi:hypothetical protein
MVARQRAEIATRTLVYQYGAVPIGSFPQEGYDELWRANRLWNQLVELHNTHRQSDEKAGCTAKKHAIFRVLSRRQRRER